MQQRPVVERVLELVGVEHIAHGLRCDRSPRLGLGIAPFGLGIAAHALDDADDAVDLATDPVPDLHRLM
ncbi:hypothetical protein, partial [Pseudomonas hunanensis]|uniref:hypothetical protein n=1 Tax=Pseudomonas hunanensis TaxID=1247546 RepID=UPI0030D8A2D8